MLPACQGPRWNSLSYRCYLLNYFAENPGFRSPYITKLMEMEAAKNLRSTEQQEGTENTSDTKECSNAERLLSTAEENVHSGKVSSKSRDCEHKERTLNEPSSDSVDSNACGISTDPVAPPGEDSSSKKASTDETRQSNTTASTTSAKSEDMLGRFILELCLFVVLSIYRLEVVSWKVRCTV